MPLREKKGEISVTHDKIKGVRNANATGALMVCVNNTAECSYGKRTGVQQFHNANYYETLHRGIKHFNRRQKSQNIS